MQIESDADWREIAANWQIRPDTIYLNQGSFGLTPKPVLDTRKHWTDRLNEQPMDFYLRTLEPAWRDARDRVADFVNVAPAELAFAENATAGMNIVADSFPLKPGDEVVLNDHEYGAVFRIWRRACQRAGAELKSAELSLPIQTAEQIVDDIFTQCTDNTRLIVVSHITSPTAIIMPVAEICRRAQSREIAVCIDGPHALAQLNVDISALGCDFYTASCHKWLSAPLGSGFIFARQIWHEHMIPTVQSWGRLLPAVPQTWDEELIWSGTRDPAAYLSVPAAIDFMEQIGIELFQQRSHYLARYARRLIEDSLGTHSIVPDNASWYGSMAHVPLPEGDWSQLQQQLWQVHGIEVPIVDFNDRWYIRVSCHLYNTTEHIDRLVRALVEITVETAAR